MRRAALSAILAFAVGGSCMQPLPAAMPVVVLRADRCAGQTTVDPRRPVVMLLDVREFDPASRFDVELIDSTGHRLDFATGLTISAVTVAYSCRGLSPGAYYLRLTENQKLRREFKINAQARPSVC